MNVIDTTPEQAEDALVALARHVPPEVELGRPLAAMREADGGTQIITTGSARWWVEPGGMAASRLLPLSGGRAELTRWRDGVQIARSIDAVP